MKNRLIKLVRVAYWNFLKIFVRGFPVRLVAWSFCFFVRERYADGTLRRVSSARHDGRVGVLALTPESFRGDLQYLSASDEVRVMQIPAKWQTRLISIQGR